MKKKIGLMLTLLCILVLCLFVFTSCGVKLSAPTGFKLNGDTLELSWNKVREATGYYIEIDDKVKTTTKKNTYPLANLDAGEHTVRVQAITNNEEIEDSDFAEYIFEKDEESGLVYKLINNNTEYELVGIGFAEGDVVMEDEFRHKPVTSIAKGAFRRSSRLTSFTIGKYVKTIGEYAFAACSELKSVTIPDTVQTISAYAFQNCPKLETLVVPGSIGKIDE